MRPHTHLRAAAAGAAFLLLAGGLSIAAAWPAAAATCTRGVPGDVSGDGYAEVAVSELGGVHLGGAVHVFYGQPSGLVVDATGTARDDQFFAQDTVGVPGSAEAGDDFGASTAFGDFDDDGCADLAVGSPHENSTGRVTVLYGSKTGIVTAGVQSFTIDSVFGAGTGHPVEHFGAALAVGDWDDDGTDDLAIGAPRKAVGPLEAGGIVVLFGDVDGLNEGNVSAAVLDQDRPGVPGEAEEDEYFGGALATGDFNGNGRDELAVGARSDGESGSIQVFERGPGGFTAKPTIDRVAAGVPDAGEGVYEFGDTLAAGDVTGDGLDDLAVGVPRWDCLECDEFQGKGAVVLLKGSASGVTTGGSQFWTQDSEGVDGVAERDDDGFGSALAIGSLDRDAYADLAVGIPGDLITDGIEGSVIVLRGSVDGLTTAGIGGQRYHQDTSGVAGSAESGDQFGAAITVAFVQIRSQASMIVSAPRESVRGVRGAGQFHQFAVGTSGPTGIGSQTYHLDSPGLKGQPSRDANFGRALG